MGFLLRASRRHKFSCSKKKIHYLSGGCLLLDWEDVSLGSLLAAISLCRLEVVGFLFAGSSSESGRRVRIDGEKRGLEEEEAVGERRARPISAAHALGMPREI